tara:strand:+ start:127 stop:507 length:381 start_codon:yes stop_codon:yes gene_type:complete
MTVGAIPPASLRGNSRAHPIVAGKTKRKWRWEGYLTVIQDDVFRGLSAPGGTTVWLEKIKITFTFCHNRKIDLDNLTIGMKPWVDGLVDAKLVSDDTPDHVIYGEHSFVKCKRGASRTEVLIEEQQ